MQFQIEINTTGAASFVVTGGMPAWYNVFKGDFELPFHWTKQQCIDSLVQYFESIVFVPYQNLAGYEAGMELATQTKILFIDELKKKMDENDPIDLLARGSDEGAVVTFNLKQIDYV